MSGNIITNINDDIEQKYFEHRLFQCENFCEFINTYTQTIETFIFQKELFA